MAVLAPNLTSCIYFNNPCELFGWAEMYILVKIKNASSHILITVIIFPIFCLTTSWLEALTSSILACSVLALSSKRPKSMYSPFIIFSLNCLVTCTPKLACTLLIAIGSVFVLNAWLLITLTESDWSDSLIIPHITVSLLWCCFWISHRTDCFYQLSPQFWHQTSNYVAYNMFRRCVHVVNLVSMCG